MVVRRWRVNVVMKKGTIIITGRCSAYLRMMRWLRGPSTFSRYDPNSNQTGTTFLTDPRFQEYVAQER